MRVCVRERESESTPSTYMVLYFTLRNSLSLSHSHKINCLRRTCLDVSQIFVHVFLCVCVCVCVCVPYIHVLFFHAPPTESDWWHYLPLSTTIPSSISGYMIHTHTYTHTHTHDATHKHTHNTHTRTRTHKFRVCVLSFPPPPCFVPQ